MNKWIKQTWSPNLLHSSQFEPEIISGKSLEQDKSDLKLCVSLHQDTAPGSSIYKVQAVDKDMGSGGSVSYYLQVNVQLCVLEDDLFSLACRRLLRIQHSRFCNHPSELNHWMDYFSLSRFYFHSRKNFYSNTLFNWGFFFFFLFFLKEVLN